MLIIQSPHFIRFLLIAVAAMSFIQCGEIENPGAVLRSDGALSGTSTAGSNTPQSGNIVCSVPPWSSPATSCTGTVIASGSMNNSDAPADAAAGCQSAHLKGTCCMYHLYGAGKWYLTDGQPQNGSRTCETDGTNFDSCMSGGSCH